MTMVLYCVIISVHTLVVLAGSIATHISNGCNIGAFDLNYDFWFNLSSNLFISGLITWVLTHVTGILLSRQLNFGIAKSMTFHSLIFAGTIFLYAAPIFILERPWNSFLP